ncbi:hypothetical protein diail_10767 [Diaporthe ilicicola]|nr:hypothetical protein diail_10767 [Diaporthe ilicicola]
MAPNEAQDSSGTYTTAYALFEALWDPKFITCPSEITAISMADGYARVLGKPQAVVVHIDVGTQALGQEVHNASVGRVPVFIFAGLCPFTESGELTSSRTEYIHWL